MLDTRLYALREHLREKERILREAAELVRLGEAAFLASLDWTDKQVTAYQDRIEGIERRLASVTGPKAIIFRLPNPYVDWSPR